MDNEKMLLWLLAGIEAFDALSDAVLARLSGIVSREQARRQPVAMLPSPPKAACVNLGMPTGEMRTCETCKGKVALKVFRCAIHGTCTVGKKVDGLACCANCGDYRES